MLKKLVVGFCLFCLILGVAAPAHAAAAQFRYQLNMNNIPNQTYGQRVCILNDYWVGLNDEERTEIGSVCQQTNGQMMTGDATRCCRFPN